MYDVAFKAVSNLQLPTQKVETSSASKGLLSRSIRPTQDSKTMDAKQTVAKYVMQIRNRRKGFNDGRS